MSRIRSRTSHELPPEPAILADASGEDGGGRREHPGASGFTFDDAVFRPSDAREAAPLRLTDAGDLQRTGGDATRSRRVHGAHRRPARAKPSTAQPAEPQAADGVSSRGLSVSLGFFGASILLLGLLFVGLQRENLGGDPLAQWRSAPAVPSESRPASPGAAPHAAAPHAAAPGAETAGTAPADRGVQRIKVPAVPGPLSNRAARPVVESRPPAAQEAVAQAARIEQQEEPVADPAPPPAPQDDADGETLYTLADEYRLLGDSERARQLYHRLFREGRQPGRAALALGDLYLEREQFAEAQEMFDLSRELFNETKSDQTKRR